MAWLRRLGATVWLVLMGVGLTLAMPAAQDSPTTVFEQNLRADLDLLAGIVFAGTLPDTWTSNTSTAAPNFIADLFFDNEQLANTVFGEGIRPDDWFGASSPTRELVSRNIRHDLEVSASFYYGGATRPEGWLGAPGRNRCDRTLQTILLVLERDFNVTPTSIEAVVDYCAVLLIEVEANIYIDLLPSVGTQIQSTDNTGGLRGDLERLADEKLGLETRPPGWIGNREAASPTFINDLSIDVNTLADNQLGLNVRPNGWNAISISTSGAVAVRALRANIETLADEVMGEGLRPNGWQGTDPLGRCDTTLQTLVTLVEAGGADIRGNLTSDERNSIVLCSQARGVAIQAAESLPVIALPGGGDGGTVDSRLLFKSRFAFSYLDVTALQYMGPMPYDMEFRPWYRNFQESDMMFVTGQDFAVFIDRKWTNMPEEVFRLLPNLEGRKPLTFCDARWCNGPGPTPTPTGNGPIIDILNAGTPQPTSISPGTGPIPTGKTLVTWNNIRVTYLFDNPATRTAQVALEICAEPAQITCESVISIYDNQTGGYKPILQQYNGLNVFDLPYNYQTNVIVEGSTRYSRDIFISEPGLRSTQPTATPSPTP